MNEALLNFHALNQFVRVADEATCLELLKQEKAGARRRLILLRIHARMNKLRGRREREELERIATR